jgi:hypothetical protein
LNNIKFRLDARCRINMEQNCIFGNAIIGSSTSRARSIDLVSVRDG